MCFAPQRRALFQHLNFQKWSETLVFLTFWLGNVLRATTACTFSTSQLPKVVRQWCVLYILTWKCASRHNGVHFFDISTSKSGPTMVCFVHFHLECALRHNGVQFFISHLASWLRTRRFSEPTFRPSWDPNHWKNRVFCDFPTFSRICIFFLLTLSLLLFFLLLFLFSLPLPCSAFHLSILSEVWLLNFLRWFMDDLPPKNNLQWGFPRLVTSPSPQIPWDPRASSGAHRPRSRPLRRPPRPRWEEASRGWRKSQWRNALAGWCRGRWRH